MAAEEKTTSVDVLAQKIAEAVAAATAKATLAVQNELKVIEKTPKAFKSAFNPNALEPGYKKPTLSRKTFFGPHEEHPDKLTPQEIELYNAITRPGRYHNRKWEVIIKEDEVDPRQSVLEVRVPCRELSDRMELPPSLVLILQEIIAEQNARDAADKKSSK